MKKILRISLIAVLLLTLFCTGVLADSAQCGRTKVNIAPDASVSIDVQDSTVTDYIANLTDGDKSTGIKSSSSTTQMPILLSFDGGGKILEEIIITVIPDTANGLASGQSYGQTPFRKSLTVYVYPADGSGIEQYDLTPGGSSQVKVDLSTYGKSVSMVEVHVNNANDTNCTIWEIELIHYKGEHTWTLSNRIETETCEKDGKGIYTCSCGAEIERTIPKKQHTLTWHRETDTHYQTCATCTNRFNEGEHEYDNPCDTNCNKCNMARVVEPHTYRAPCATVCEKCAGAERTPELAYHTYYSNSACDEICEFCFEKRVTTTPHTYDNNCDTTCNVCTSIREVPDHVYTNDSACDEFCDECNARRTTTVAHKYTNGAECDEECDICNTKRQTSVDHAFTNRCDPKCNKCGFERTEASDQTYVANHYYDSACDEECNFCQAKRTASHAYDNACDRTCNNCQFERPANHVYSNKEGVVTLPATEKGEGIRTITCDVCGHTETKTIPRLPKKDNTPLIIAIVVSAVVILGCAGIALYSLVFKKKKEEQQRKLQAYLKAQEEAKKAQEEAEAEEEEEEEIVPAFGGSMYDDSDNTSTTSSFTGIGIGSFPTETNDEDTDDTEE